MRLLLLPAALLLASAASAQASTAAAETYACPAAGQKAEITLAAKDASGDRVAALAVNGQAVDPATLRFINSQIGDRAVESVTSTCHDNAMDLLIAVNASKTREAGAVTINAKGTTLKVR